MGSKLLPDQISNEFPGYRFSYYMFILLTIVTVIRSLVHIFFPDGGAESIATIDVDVAGGDAIILIFAYWGLSQLLLVFVFVVVIIKYRSLIPLMYLLMFFEYTLRLVISLFKPVVTQGTAPGAIGNLVLPFVTLVLLYFSIKSNDSV